MITYIIIALNCIVSFIGFRDRNFFEKYLYHPYSMKRNHKEWYRVFTHTFLHADLGHFAFNMIALYSFGLPLEQYFYPTFFPNHAEFYFLMLYIGGIIVSSMPAFEKQKDNYGYRAIGASGAVSGVVFAVILISPRTPLNLFFIPIDIPGWIFGLCYLGYSWYMTKRGRDNYAHDAHLWGSLYGFVFTLLLHPAFFPDFINQILSRS